MNLALARVLLPGRFCECQGSGAVGCFYACVTCCGYAYITWCVCVCRVKRFCACHVMELCVCHMMRLCLRDEYCQTPLHLFVCAISFCIDRFFFAISASVWSVKLLRRLVCLSFIVARQCREQLHPSSSCGFHVESDSEMSFFGIIRLWTLCQLFRPRASYFSESSQTLQVFHYTSIQF